MEDLPGKTTTDQQPNRTGRRLLLAALVLYGVSMLMPAVKGFQMMPGWEAAWFSCYGAASLIADRLLGGPFTTPATICVLLFVGTQCNLSMLLGVVLMWSRRWTVRWIMFGVLLMAAVLALLVPWIGPFFDSGMTATAMPTNVTDIVNSISLRYHEFGLGYYVWTASLCLAACGAWFHLRARCPDEDGHRSTAEFQQQTCDQRQ
jgi:hypothetical protein